jgi:hypothetical protein
VVILRSAEWHGVLFIVSSLIVVFLYISITIVPCLFKTFRSRYDVCLFSSVIVNGIALCCLLKCSNIDSGVILFWL